jgi:hypothetical protein
VQIPKGFKSFVLELRILKGLGVCFGEVRILWELGRREVGRVESWKVCMLRTEGEGSELNGEAQSTQSSEKEMGAERMGRNGWGEPGVRGCGVPFSVVQGKGESVRGSLRNSGQAG